VKGKNRPTQKECGGVSLCQRLASLGFHRLRHSFCLFSGVYPELCKNSRNVEAERLLLLQQSEYEGWPRAGYTSDTAGSVSISAVSLLDHNHFVDVSERSSHCSENARGGLQNGR
jgi:hypothetical protein